MLRILLLTALSATTAAQALADAPRPRRAAAPGPKTTDPGGYFKKGGQNPPASDVPFLQQKTTNVPGLDYEPRRQEDFDLQGNPTGKNLLINRVSDIQFRLRLKHASGALDDWARKLEEYGNVTMSSPILTRENSGFEFAVNDGAEQFYQHAKERKDGGAAAVLAIVNQFSVAGQATIDPLSGLALKNTIITANAEQELYKRQLRANIEAQVAREKAADLKRDATVRQIQGENISVGDVEKIKTAGMDVTKEREPAKPLPPPEGFGASYGDTLGEIDVHWNPLNSRRSYEIQHAKTETGPWTNAPSVTKSKAALEGLVSGKHYYLPVRGLNPAGPGAWSGTISQRAS